MSEHFFDRYLTSTNNLSQSWPWSNGNKRVLHFTQSSISGLSPNLV